MSNPVEAIIGLGLEVKGQAWDKLHSQLDKHVKDWRNVEGSVERIGTHVESLSNRLMQLGGAVGVAGLLNDFVQLENQANRTALAVGSVTGSSSGYRPIGQQLLGAGRQTGFYGGELGAAIYNLQMRAGGTYLGKPGAIPGVARALGTFGGAYNMDPSDLASQIGTLELFQRQNPGSTPQLLNQMASQAARSGMAGQTSLFTQTVSQIVSGLVAQHPAAAGPGANLRVGAMYGAAQSVNPAFRDAGVFGQGISGVDQAVTGAYQNPRLQAVMQMAGIGYWDQRGGLAGPHGPEIARKILAWSSAEYGQGSVAQDMFLRSNFGGNVSADLLQALGSGKGTAAQHAIGQAGTDPGALARARSSMQLRSQQYQQTPGAALNRGRNALEQELFGLFGGIGTDAYNFVAGHPLEALAGAYGLKKAIPRVAGGVGRFALSRGQSFAAQQAARAIAGAAVDGGGAVAGDVAAEAAGGSTGLLAGGFGAAAGSIALGAAGAYAGFMLFPDSAGEVNPRGGMAASIRNSRAHIEHSISTRLAAKYGNDWWTKAPALAEMDHLIGRNTGSAHARRTMQKQMRQSIAGAAAHVARGSREGPVGDVLSTLLGNVPGIGSGLSGLFDLGAQMYTKGHPGHDAGSALLGMLGHHGGHAGGGIASATAKKFDNSVDKFGRIIQQMGLGGFKGASFMGSGAGGAAAGTLNAGMLTGGNDATGAAMLLARYVAGGSGGGSGGSGNPTVDLQNAALGIGGGGGASPVTGGGWQSCELTWYDPALGGTNSGNGRKDPHHPTASGQPYDARAFTCAAPPSYSFGTRIAFSYKGQQITCTVNDRGGAITGHHFDLSRGAASALGVIAAGRVTAKFKVVGSGGGHSKKGKGPHPQLSTAKAGAGEAADPFGTALTWQASGGGGAGGGGGGVGGGGGGGVVVNVDGRRIEHYQALTRRAV